QAPDAEPGAGPAGEAQPAGGAQPATEPPPPPPAEPEAASRPVVPVDPGLPAREGDRLGPLVLRVGLATDLPSLSLPCCDPRITVDVDGEPAAVDRAVKIEPGAGIQKRAVYRLQVAALKDERQAQGIADYLAESTEYDAASIFDSDLDLYRVRVGRFATRQDAEGAQGRLAGLGVTSSFVVSEGGKLEDASLVVHRGGASSRVPGRWLEIDAPEGVGIPFDKRRYRGKILVFLNERGLLNVINEIELEDYLRGVVPKEMGPELYNQIEALKAQTVAARTYTLRNLGEFANEGYDICSTPRCQVYAGMGVEHPLSDRAIRETAGQVVLWEGQPAETFYSATCGGHTENVEVVFPLKSGPYLKGVPCMEAGVTKLEGDRARGTRFPDGLVQELLPPMAAPPTEALANRLEQLAGRAGLQGPRDQLRSLRRDEVLRYVLSLFDLVIDRRIAESLHRLDPLLRQPPADWQSRDRDLALYLATSGMTTRGEETLEVREVEMLLYQLARYLGVVREQRGHFLKLDGDHLHLRVDGKWPSYPLPGHFATFRRRGDAVKAGPLDLMAGDRLRLYLSGGELVAMVQPVDAPTVVLGRRAPRQKWSMFKSDAEVRAAVQKRYPGFPFAGFQVLERGVSGRVGRMALLGTDGRRLEVEGLAVRWTLDVPDTLFRARRQDRGDRQGWLFHGRGWGHGVGMSQAGAFGMAARGATYREILEHYYTGVELGRLKPAPPRPRTPAG
ncbi:MAG: SpoIID/LytB domain-containing protein, partial [Acidobacteriota bacterium]